MTHTLPIIRPVPTRLTPFLVYIALFHTLWICWPFVVYPWLTTLGETTLTYALVNITLRSLFWVVPVLLYLRWVDGVNPWDYLKLTRNWQRGVLIGLGVTAINALLSLARFGMPQLTVAAFTWNSVLSTSILIGFIEEVPYRGFMLQKFQERMPFWAANLVTTLLFVGIHVPGWIALHVFQIEYIVFVGVLGLVLGLVFHSSRSLWSAVIAHSLNDLLGVIFR